MTNKELINMTAFLTDQNPEVVEKILKTAFLNCIRGALENGDADVTIDNYGKFEIINGKTTFTVFPRKQR